MRALSFSLADTACGYFTTIELKGNFLGTTLEGDLICVAKPVHKSRTTQVCAAEVRAEESGKTIAVFGCT
jgi:1,4-dihydroxy-2-naphthoyl-CoA hydrolase